MDRFSPTRAAMRIPTQHRDARDPRAVIADALAAAPIDERAVRDGVWTYVRGERDVGVAPGVVILPLTDMVERAKIVPDVARITQRGGVAVGRDREASVDPSAAVPVAEPMQGTARTGL